MDSLILLPFVRGSEIRAALVAAAANLENDFRTKGESISDDFFLKGPSEAISPQNNTIIFANNADTLAGLASHAISRTLTGCLLIVPFDDTIDRFADQLAERNFVARARNPKYAYAIIAGILYPLSRWRGELTRPIGTNAWAAEDTEIADGTVIEPDVTIGQGARIGKGCILMHGCSIGPHVEIGDGCIIREKAVAGDLGFGFAFDGKRPPVRLPQLGGVKLGKDVELGAFSTIGAGTMRPTVIEDYVKISDHVHIAHNCHIGTRTIMTGGVIILGSSTIGPDCWLASGAIIRNRITLGSEVTVGMGAVVTENIASGLTVIGVPAKPTDRPAGRPISQS